MKKLSSEKNKQILLRLTAIYRKFSQKRRIDVDSQMCCFWADPTVDMLVGSDELTTLELEFGIEFDDDSAMELYDMTLGEAANLIGKMVEEQNAESYDPDDFVNNLPPEDAKEILKYLWKNNVDLRPAIQLAHDEIELENNQE